MSFSIQSCEKVKLQYDNNWNGRRIHFGKNYFLTSAILVVELFMTCLGYGLLAGAYPITGLLMTLVGGVFLCRTVKNISKNELKEALGRILGDVENIDTLPTFSVKSYENYPEIKNDDVKDCIMRIADQKGKTLAVIFNFEQYKYLSNEKKPKKSTLTWVFYLNYTMPSKVVTEANRKIVFKGTMHSQQGDFLEHLVKNNGMLESNGKKSFHLFPGRIPIKETQKRC